MKKRVIILIIVLLSITLTGLIYIQLYWIRNAISVKEANFDRSVSDAVSSVVYKYNKIELANKLLMRRAQNQQIDQVYSALDSLNRLYYEKIYHSGNSNQSDDGSFVFESRFSIDYSQSTNRKPGHTFDTSFVSINRPLSADNQGYVQRNPVSGIDDPSFRLFRERTKIINDLFDDLFFNRFSFSLSSEVNKNMLDSLISIELQNQGIKTEYEFGLYNPAFNKLTAEKTGNYSENLLKDGYVFSLFPNAVFTNPEYLLLFFPDQKKYVLSQLNLMLGISTVFIFIIIFSFVFIIFTVFRQKKLSVMKNDFINNMTHELKTPISTISLACQALNDTDVRKTEKLYQSYITMINEENKRLGAMTEKVLQTALIDKGKLRLNVSGVDVHEIIINAIEKTSLQLKSRHGEIITDFNAEYPYLEADKMHLTNVVFNLLDNAIKYTIKTPYILVSTENSDKGIIIKVKDNGVGISKSHRNKIFDNLYRVSTGNIHDVKGFGLGLSYVKRVVELHGGNINIVSELKNGSTFIVFLPFGFNHQNNNNNNQKH